jgi:phage gpG-like protein
MSEMRGIRFATGNSPTTGAISLSNFRNQVLTAAWSQRAKIKASDRQSSDRFGESVAISSDGNYAIVGARYEDTGAANAGSAYIFTRSGTSWSQQAKIQASDRQATDYFSISVAISSDGTTVIVGAFQEDTGGSNAGAAYIFTRSGTSWSQQAKIQASEIQADDRFGQSVSISSDGNYAIIGANGDDDGVNNAGAAYIFTRSGTSWSQQAKIQASDRQSSDYFGGNVAISGDGATSIVGVFFKSTGGSTAGAAYIFTRSGTSWSQQAKILASDTQAFDRFGQSVSISGDGATVIVGASGEDTAATEAGAAYIFTRSGTSWSQQAKIQAPDAETEDRFGASVGISSDGTTVIVGASWEDTGATQAGAAYIFTRSGTSWSHQVKIQASDKQASDYFGGSVAISGDGTTSIVGATDEDTGATNSGSAYIHNYGYYI